MIRKRLLTTTLLLIMTSMVFAQSSSLYVEQPQPVTPTLSANGRPNRLAPPIGRDSFTAVSMPTPRKYAVHDLITIIVREATETDIEAELETDKSTDIQGSITAMPRLNITDLLNLQLRDNVISDPPTVNVTFDKGFKGDGEYNRKDTFTSRITAKIIDVKPNGTLILEARKFIKSDKESLEMVLTGTCRKDDVTIANTVLSTQMADLQITKKHGGEIRRATKKGILTRVLEIIFNF